MSTKVKIGVFDSGIGGLSVLKEILDKSSLFEAYYISDDAYTPYGNKSDNEIINRSHYITELLLEKEVSLVVVACNSATAVAVKSLRDKYPNIPFVGVEPYLNALNHKDLFPNITSAGVITTVMTGKSEKFTKLKRSRDPENKITHIALPRLASCVEDIFYNGSNSTNLKEIKDELAPLKEYSFSHLILGCTHYPLITDIIEDTLGLSTISSGVFVANRVCDLLAVESNGSKTDHFFFTGTNEFSWKKKPSEFATCR